MGLFILGLFIGASIGVFTMALVTSGGCSDELAGHK